ncbi:MAG: helix-turn-helix domain-containing protein [Proteobacteria bacterium]|nr:helix-turn-helix domain-containing protein [Pseudomonadota bacterium]
MKLGEKIKLLRTEKELTQPELAQKAGIEQSYLSKVENDKAVPSFDIINRISMALETTGMELIDELSQSYVEKELSHIPEIAAEYAAIRYKREVKMKNRFVFAALLVVFGIGVVLTGYKILLFSETAYHYQSDGIIKVDENILQFHSYPISEINETIIETKERLNKNRGRFDRVFLKLRENKGNAFVRKVEGGARRYYYYESRSIKDCIGNDLISIFGIMLVSAGLFFFLFNIRFKP